MVANGTKVITDKIGDYFVYFLNPTKLVALYAHNSNERVSAVFNHHGKGVLSVVNIGRLTNLDCSLITEFVALNYKDILKHSGF